MSGMKAKRKRWHLLANTAGFSPRTLLWVEEWFTQPERLFASELSTHGLAGNIESTYFVQPEARRHG